LGRADVERAANEIVVDAPPLLRSENGPEFVATTLKL
jgi:hypothetical protein